MRLPRVRPLIYWLSIVYFTWPRMPRSQAGRNTCSSLIQFFYHQIPACKTESPFILMISILPRSYCLAQVKLLLFAAISCISRGLKCRFCSSLALPRSIYVNTASKSYTITIRYLKNSSSVMQKNIAITVI